MSESIIERARRLRPLVPNCVTDRILRMRIAAGWDDQQIVTHDLISRAETSFSPPPRARRSRHANPRAQAARIELALFNA
ncbi:MAG TPA: hypothetical protein VGE51_08515 [Fontimonas sp.]